MDYEVRIEELVLLAGFSQYFNIQVFQVEF